MNRIEDLDGNPLWDKDNGILGNVTTSTGVESLSESLDKRIVYVDDIEDLEELDPVSDNAIVRVANVGNFYRESGAFHREKEAGRGVVITKDFTLPSRLIGETVLLRNNQKVTVTIPEGIGVDGESVTFMVDGPGEIAVDLGGSSVINLTESRVPITFLKYSGEWTLAAGASLELPAVRSRLIDIKTTETTASPSFTHTGVQFGDPEGRTLVLAFFASGITNEVPEQITVAGEDAVIFGLSGSLATRVYHAIVQLPYDVTEGDVYIKYPDGERSARHGFAVWGVYGLEDPFNPVDVRLRSPSSAATSQAKKGGVVLALTWGTQEEGGEGVAHTRIAEFASYYAGANGVIDIDTEFQDAEKIRWWGLTPKGSTTLGTTTADFSPRKSFISLR